MTWLELSQLVTARFPEYRVIRKSLAASIKQFVARDSKASVEAAIYEIMGHSEALAFSPQKIASHQEKFFKNLKFRTVDELLDEAAARPASVV